MHLLRCKFKLFVYPLFSIYEMDIWKWNEVLEDNIGSKQVGGFRDECCSLEFNIFHQRCPMPHLYQTEDKVQLIPGGGSLRENA